MWIDQAVSVALIRHASDPAISQLISQPSLHIIGSYVKSSE